MVKIVADSTCDLSPELLERYDISVLPLYIHLGDKEYRDGVDIGPDEIYAWCDAQKSTPKTSAVGMQETMELFSRLLEEADELVCFSISGQLSTGVGVMQLAAWELEQSDRIHVIDSQNLSTGFGAMVIEGAELAEAGATGQEIVAHIEQRKPKARASFVVDTLTYLHRGGRCSGLEAMLGGVLKLHPKIVVENGVLRATKKYRGQMQKVTLDYVKDMEADLLAAEPKRVFVTHSGCSAELIDRVVAYLEGLDHFCEIHVTRAGGVITSHCGPGTLGVLYMAQ